MGWELFPEPAPAPAVSGARPGGGGAGGVRPGVSPRRVDDLVRAMGMDGISTSQVVRLCQELDAAVECFRTRRPYLYVWLDATLVLVKERDQGRGIEGRGAGGRCAGHK